MGKKKKETIKMVLQNLMRKVKQNKLVAAMSVVFTFLSWIIIIALLEMNIEFSKPLMDILLSFLGFIHSVIPIQTVAMIVILLVLLSPSIFVFNFGLKNRVKFMRVVRSLIFVSIIVVGPMFLMGEGDAGSFNPAMLPAMLLSYVVPSIDFGIIMLGTLLAYFAIGYLYSHKIPLLNKIR